MNLQTGQYLSGGAKFSSEGGSWGSASLSLEDLDLALPREPGLFLSFSASFSAWTKMQKWCKLSFLKTEIYHSNVKLFKRLSKEDKNIPFSEQIVPS